MILSGGGISRDVVLGIDALGHEVNHFNAGCAIVVDMGEASDVHPADHPAQTQHLFFRLEVEIPEGSLSATEQPLERGLAQLDGMTGKENEVGLERMGEVIHEMTRPGAGVATPPHHINQPAAMSERARRADDRGLRFLCSAGPENDDAHAGIIALASVAPDQVGRIK